MDTTRTDLPQVFAATRHGLRRLCLLLTATVGVALISAGAAAAQTPSISATPALFPAFNAQATDYVTRCGPSDQVQVSVNAPAGDTVSVDNGPPQTGSFTQTVSIGPGQEFQIASSDGAQTQTYYVRCLPSDFPAFTATRTGTTQAQFYIVAPHQYQAAGVSHQYVAFFDDNGVPLWWMKSAGISEPADADLLSNGDVVWTHSYGIGGAGAEEHRLDGTLARINTVGGGADHHDILLLPNGDYVIGRSFMRTGVDMSSCGGSTRGTLRDFELQELTPSGALVWSWLASDHIPVSEVAAQFKGNCGFGGDIYHWNSVEPDGNGFVLSFRNLDAVYDIDKATGDPIWKLGGKPEPESLSVIGDPDSSVSTFCGQHDARVLPDGTVTVFDDGTGCGRTARSVRYAVDTTSMTATLVQSLTRPLTHSWCCGSTRMLPGGDWVTDWGSTRYVTEQSASGATIFQLSFAQLASYRAIPVLPGQVTAAQLRAGMNAQYPRP